ncbi:hypothetical protein Tco_0752664 [Tanacetum coccineum]|uniref:Metallothionein-like protein n=1 Tax=Tanacetum coccineum TaxID=301880 RepID=A0ABQ4ZB88_9ASTR
MIVTVVAMVASDGRRVLLVSESRWSNGEVRFKRENETEKMKVKIVSGKTNVSGKWKDIDSLVRFTVETIVMEVPAAENDGKCTCGANCSCTNCTCGHLSNNMIQLELMCVQ